LLESAMKSCEEAKMTEETVYKDAIALKEQLLREAVVAETSGVLRSALESKNYKVLEVAVKTAKEKELAEDPLTKQAEAMMVVILKNQEINTKLLAAIESRNLESLNAILGLALEAKLPEWGMNYQLAVTRASKLQKQIQNAQKALEEAVASDDLKIVEGALEEAAKIGSPPLIPLLEQAKKQKTFLYEKKDRRELLKTAHESNNEGLLVNAIERATKDGHFKSTDEEIRNAVAQADKLKLERILREQELAAAKAAAEEEKRFKEEEEIRRKEEEERHKKEEEEEARRQEEEAKEEERRKKEEEERKKREKEERAKIEEERKRREEEEKKKKRRRRKIITRRIRETKERSKK